MQFINENNHLQDFENKQGQLKQFLFILLFFKKLISHAFSSIDQSFILKGIDLKLFDKIGSDINSAVSRKQIGEILEHFLVLHPDILQGASILTSSNCQQVNYRISDQSEVITTAFDSINRHQDLSVSNAHVVVASPITSAALNV